MKGSSWVGASPRDTLNGRSLKSMLRIRKPVSLSFSQLKSISSTTCGSTDGCDQELWNIFHNELDLDSNGHLDAEELTVALRKAGGRILLLCLCDFFSIRRCGRGTSVSVH